MKRILIALMLLLAACGSEAGDTTTTLADAGVDNSTTESTPAETTTSVAAETTTSPPTETTTAAAPTSSNIPAELANALAMTSNLSSGRMEGSFEIFGAEGVPSDTPLSMPFSGAFDTEAGVYTFSMDMSSLAGDLGEGIPPEMADLFGVMEVRQIGDTTYTSWPLLSFLGVQTEWVATPTTEEAIASGFGGAAPSNPAAFLSFFNETAATIEELGRETIRGVATTHYLAVFDTESLLEQASPEERAEIEAQGPIPLEEMPMEIWIGDDGLIYRYVIDIGAEDVETAPGEGFERMVMTFEMYDWGAEITVEEPDPADVTDGTELDALFGP